ncbi:MAG: type II toxin-antitoxin system RelE/ParE family toxin [Prochloraceae cyanobacterium]|nr:type II toxin-antitoxin system RelE/ParE family toxin [Prochloraceae cyanobacterium]
MSSYSFSDVAVQDLNEICEYIAQNNPNAASKLFDSIRQKCVLIAKFPNMGKSYELLSSGLRGFIVIDILPRYSALAFSGGFPDLTI